MWKWAGRIKATWSWARFAWQLVIFFGLTGVVTSVGGSVWAVIGGVPIPIAIMVGYCTLVGAVYLAMAPLAYRALSQSPANATRISALPPPDYTAWSHVQVLTLGQAARLWCDLDPSAGNASAGVNTWLAVFKDAIKHGELPPTFNALDDPVDIKYSYVSPSDDVKVKRADLKAFAKSKNCDPRFLRDNP